MKKNLSPRQLARATGVSESTIKRWVDDGRLQATRTVGGHRRIDVEEAVRFLRQNQITPASPEVLGVPMPFREERPTLEGAAEKLERALRDGDREEVQGIVLGLYLCGHNPASIIDGPVRQAMTHIGEIWGNRPEGIFLEHRASDLCLHALHRLRAWMSVEAPRAVAVGGAIAGDPYQLPTLSVALALTDLGVEAVNLGADCPFETLLDGARAHDARLVWLSVTSLPLPRQSLPAIADLAATLQAEGRALVVGGQGMQARTVERVPNLHYVPDLAGLETLLESLFPRAA